MQRHLSRPAYCLCALALTGLLSAATSARAQPLQVSSVGALTALKTAGMPAGENVQTHGYYAGSRKGAAAYEWAPRNNAKPDCAHIQPASGGAGRWVIRTNGPLVNTMCGARADSVSDDTAASLETVRAALVLGVPARIAPGSVLGGPNGPLLLGGHGFDGARLILDHFEVGIRPERHASNYQGAWVGVAVEDADNVTVSGSCDQRGSRQPPEEHVFCLAIAGTAGTRIPAFSAIHLRGDAIYVSQSDFHHGSRQTTGLRIGTLTCRNEQDDGRNCLSVISASDTRVAKIVSIHVGGIGTIREPGGLDLEPNTAYQSVNNFTLADGTFVCGPYATQCLGVYGRDIANGYNISNVSFNAWVQCDRESCGGFEGVQHARLDLYLSTSPVTPKHACGPFINRARDISGRVRTSGYLRRDSFPGSILCKAFHFPKLHLITPTTSND